MATASNNRLEGVRWQATRRSSVFTEIGIDFDYNQYGIGVSTEIEDQNGKEARISGFTKMNIKGVYVRLWIFKRVIGVGIPGGVIMKMKNRNNFKFVLGVAGEKNK